MDDLITTTVKEVVSSSGLMGDDDDDDDDDDNNGGEITSPAAAAARSGLLPPVQPPTPIGTTITSNSGLLVSKKIKTSSTTTAYNNNTISDAGTQVVVVERYVHFIYNGRDIDGKDMVGNTPLMDALNKSYDPTRFLHDSVVESNDDDDNVDSGLHNTGEPDHTGIFLLLELLPRCYNNSTSNRRNKNQNQNELVDIEARNMYGRSPLDFAALIAIDIGVVKLLIQKGVDVNAKLTRGNFGPCDELEMTVLHKACMYYQNRTDIIEVLLESGKADIESKDYHGNTPLHLASCSVVAANRNNPNIVKLLIEKGANVHRHYTRHYRHYTRHY